jgi:uncharacterized protein YvpB
MSRIHDFAGLKVATPLVDVDEAKKNNNPQTAKHAARLFEPAPQTLTVLNNPALALKIITTIAPAEPKAPALGNSAAANIGSISSALTATGPTMLPNAADMPFLEQEGNACGTTTLAMIMSYLGVPMTQGDVDSAIRRTNIFTAPDDMIEFARDHGLEAEGYNNGTWEEVKAMIDAGHPVQAMVDGDDSVQVNGGSETFSVDGLHYIAITGYGTDPATGEEYVVYHDPNRTTEQRMSVDDFEKMWGDVPGGFENYFVAYGPEGADLPPGRDDGIESTLGVLNGVTNVTNGIDRIFSPDSFGSWLHGFPQLIGGAVQTVGSFVGGLAQLGAGWLNNAVEGIPVLENIVQPLGDLVNGVGAVIGDIFNGIGEAADSLGGAVESLFEGDLGGFVEGVGDAVGDVAGGVVDAVGDAVDAVGDAVSDFFSGW